VFRLSQPCYYPMQCESGLCITNFCAAQKAGNGFNCNMHQVLLFFFSIFFFSSFFFVIYHSNSLDRIVNLDFVFRLDLAVEFVKPRINVKKKKIDFEFVFSFNTLILFSILRYNTVTIGSTCLYDQQCSTDYCACCMNDFSFLFFLSFFFFFFNLYYFCSC